VWRGVFCCASARYDPRVMSEDSTPQEENAPPVQSPNYSAPPTYQQAYPRAASTNKLIPTSNPKALLAYYLGIFGLIPGFCIVLGPAALALGILGLKAAKEHPEIAGKVHAWIGIVLGGLSTLACVVLVVLIAFAR
jgi:hypothetical protein